MKKIILTIIVIIIITSCASKATVKPVINFEKDNSLMYQNRICTLLGNANNFNKRYFTFGFTDKYDRAPIDDLVKVYGKKMMKEYPFYYSTMDFLSGLFRLKTNCDKSNFFIVIDDVELRQNFIHLGEMGSSKVEYYVIMKININGNDKRTYTALTKTPKYNSFTSNKKFENHILEAKKAAFKAIFKQLDNDLKQLK